VHFGAEKSAGDALSTVTRAQYDKSWRVAFDPTAPVSNNLNFEQSAIFLDQQNPEIKNDECVIGGLVQSPASPNCNGSSSNLSSDWAKAAKGFYTSPPQSWYDFLHVMRQNIANN
jgi:hypothetical protein